MNHLLLSAVFLQKTFAYSPREVSFRPQIDLNQTLKERNRDFFRQLARPRQIAKKVFEKSKTSRDLRSNKILNKYNTQKTTLIIAPHPDDEILGTTNLIKKKLKSREKIKIIYLTNGDALDPKDPQKSQHYGFYRLQESRRATRRLGLTQNDLYFLGFPDAYSDKLPDENSIKSKFTKRDKTYRTSYFPNLKYSRASLKNALKKLLNQIKPTEIYFTSEDDNNVDHSAVKKLLPPNPAKKFTYKIHHTECENEICPCNQEVDLEKLNLIRIFKSQRFTPHHEKFLDQFACQKEVFTEIQ